MSSPHPENLKKSEHRFLGVHFVDCRAYGRLYLNAEGTAYVGRCPRCGATVQARVGAHGTDQRFFLAACGR
jgi:phage FluMu protein Com